MEYFPVPKHLTINPSQMTIPNPNSDPLFEAFHQKTESFSKAKYYFNLLKNYDV